MYGAWCGGPTMLGVMNARSIRNKGPLLADIVTLRDFLCLTGTHVHLSDTDSLPQSS